MDDCRPLGEPGDPDERVLDLSYNSSLYGFIQVARDGAGYSVPMDCAIRVIAPEGYHLIARIETVDIPFWNCTYDKVSVSGHSNTSVFCGLISEFNGDGRELESIRSTANWLQFAMQAVSDPGGSYLGFVAYYTAIHPEPCNNKGKNATEYRCSNGYCAPKEVACDGLDNCGDWSDERFPVCEITLIVVIISVVCSLIGIPCIAILACCIWANYYK